MILCMKGYYQRVMNQCHKYHHGTLNFSQKKTNTQEKHTNDTSTTNNDNNKSSMKSIKLIIESYKIRKRRFRN